MVCEPIVQPCRNAGCLWHATDTRGQIHAPPALGDCELAQQKERLAWLGGDPVRVTSAGIQKGKIGLRSRPPADLDQFVLDFERIQRLVFAEADGFHGCSPECQVCQVSSITTTIPQMVSSVFPTA